MTTENLLPSPSQEPSKSRTVLWVSVAAASGLLLGITGTLTVTTIVNAGALAAAQEAADTRLVDAVDKCGSADGIELGDGDRTLVIDVQGDEDASGASYVDQMCILEELDIPASAESHMNQTTSMDGRQSASWDGITIEWSYHPDRGSDMVVMLDG